MSQTKIEIPEVKLADFCRRYQVKRLALFGSAVRGGFGPESDVDVLVLFKPGARIGFLTLGRMKRELSGLFGSSVDLVPQRGLKPIIRELILSSAEEIYAA